MTEQNADALHVAVKALARRELSEAELLERLTRAGIDSQEAENAVATLRGAGYQSDTRAARERARVLAQRGLGDNGIIADLRSRGLSGETLEPIVAELPTELERAKKLALRFGTGRRFVLALHRKGYSEETIHAAATADVAEAP